MKIKRTIENVFSVLQDSNGVYITKEIGLYDINESFLEKGDYFNNSNGFIYGYDGDNTLVKIGDTFENIASGYTSGCTVFSVDSVICYKLKLKENKVDYRLKNKNGLFDFSIDGRNVPISRFMNKIAFTDRKHQILLYDLDDNIILWHYQLPEGFKIFGSVQAIDDVLFFIAYKDNHYQLVTGLDIETGTVLYQNQYEVTNERKFISAHAYNPLDKLFYGLGDVYQIFNPKTGEIVLEKTVEECESKVIRPYVNSIYENKLWFISGKYEDVKFGCLDLDTQEVEFIQDFPQENDEMFEAPIYHENKLYLKGIHYNQLYVFE